MHKLTPRIVFRSAQQYHAACERLRSAPSKQEAFAVAYPCLFMACMASELYLKCMVFSFSGQVPRHHNLEKLYKNLPDEVQELISTRWEARRVLLRPQIQAITRHFGKAVDTSLVGAFRGASLWNEDLRYLWEQRDDGYNLFQDMPHILQDIIMNELRPEWLQRRE
jgi:hypothetical protein